MASSKEKVGVSTGKGFHPAVPVLVQLGKTDNVYKVSVAGLYFCNFSDDDGYLYTFSLLVDPAYMEEYHDGQMTIYSDTRKIHYMGSNKDITATLQDGNFIFTVTEQGSYFTDVIPDSVCYISASATVFGVTS